MRIAAAYREFLKPGAGRLRSCRFFAVTRVTGLAPMAAVVGRCLAGDIGWNPVQVAKTCRCISRDPRASPARAPGRPVGEQCRGG